MSNGKGPSESVPKTTERVSTRAVAWWKSLPATLRKPAIGAGVAVATVLAAGAFLGVTEAALAGVAAWAVFRTLRKGAEQSETTGEPAHASK